MPYNWLIVSIDRRCLNIILRESQPGV